MHIFSNPNTKSYEWIPFNAHFRVMFLHCVEEKFVDPLEVLEVI